MMIGNEQKWDADKAAYFDNKRAVERLPKAQEPARQEKKETPKLRKVQQRETEFVDYEIREPAKPNPAMILVQCFGAGLFHGMIQVALAYLFATDGITAYGLMVGTMANCIIAGWRVCWRFRN